MDDNAAALLSNTTVAKKTREIGVLTISETGKVYTNDNVDAVLDRFRPDSSNRGKNNRLIKEKVFKKENIDGVFGLDQPIENLGVMELLEYAMELKDLRENAEARLEELSIQKFSSLWPFVADEDVIKSEFLHLNFMVEENYDCCLNSDNATPLGTAKLEND
ncbi:hypothetical protein REPUB_Repub13aG0146800 [Reevesia pubescens]